VIEITRISSTPRPFWRVKSDQREVSHRPASKQKRGFLHKCDGHAAEKSRAAQHFPVFEKISWLQNSRAYSNIYSNIYRSMNKTKVCTKCLERKVLDEFTRHPLLREGRMNHCKKCRA